MTIDPVQHGVRSHAGRQSAGGTLWLLPLLCVTALAGPGLAQVTAPAPQVWKFAFGPPTAVTRAGFTKVTVQDAFTPAPAPAPAPAPGKGYGFASVQGLVAYDRGGAAITRPKDEYTASVYGAYRTTSDLTCALIEGPSDNAFEVAAPDGAYTVWLIASDAAWDPPLFEVWANGRKQLDVRIPRARFVYMEPFAARATGGRLRIELKGPHGWVLSGLVIGQDGPDLADTVAQLERDIFFLTEPELPNWKEAKPAPAHPPLEWTAAEQAKGYVVFPADYTEPIVPSFVPARAAVGQPLTAFAAPGQDEPATLGVLARQDLGTVSVELADFVGDQGQPPLARRHVDVGVVRCWPTRADDAGSQGAYRVVPNLIEPPTGRACQVRADQIKQWWLTVHVPTDAPAGRYRMALTLRPEKAPPTVVEWRLLVLPFALTRPADQHWGTWLDRFPPLGGLEGPARRGRNTPAEIDRLARADMADYRAHGFDLALLNYYFGAKENPDGSFTYDLRTLPRDLEYLKLLGASTPVVLTIEYTCRNFEYDFAEPGREHVPGTFSPKAHRAIVGLVRHIRDEAQRRGWPKLYFYPIDEPGNNKTLNRMRFAENVLSFVHEVPGAQTATTLTAGDVQRLGDRVDVRIYAYGHFTRSKVVQEAQQGHPFWYYHNGMFYAHSPTASRGYAGFEFLRSGAEVATAWGFAATNANPYNDFDGGHKDWNVLFPGVDQPTPTIYWELCRAGVDDCRYVATLQAQIRQARARGEGPAAQRAEQVLAPLLDPEAARIDQPRAFSRYRWRLAREVLSLRGDRSQALAFAAVADNPAAPEALGPNVIQDPSFEAGPQADGFPTRGYAIADAYSTAANKPIGALQVTDEVAHSGRFSLKWDFRQAEGKGFVYDRNRYLIVNVQVPPEAAQSLRGRRVKVGCWFRLGGGALVPGMNLRQSGRGQYLGGIEYQGGVQDPAVWNRFEAEGRLRSDFESLDIHLHCRIPDDPELMKKSFFYLDDLALQAIEEPPLAIATPLDEYYVGEPIPWIVSAAAPTGDPPKLALYAGDRLLREQAAAAGALPWRGTWMTRELAPGVYTLRATLALPPQAPRTAQRQVIVAPDPFAW